MWVIDWLKSIADNKARQADAEERQAAAQERIATALEKLIQQFITQPFK